MSDNLFSLFMRISLPALRFNSSPQKKSSTQKGYSVCDRVLIFRAEELLGLDVASALCADESRDSELESGVELNTAVLIDVGDEQLDRGVVLRTQNLGGDGALAGKVFLDNLVFGVL